MDTKDTKMIKITFPLTLLMLISSSSLAFSEDMLTKVTVLDKGIKRIMHISKEENQTTGRMNAYSAKKLTSKEGIIVKFKKISSGSINEFEIKYGLKLKHKLVTGYYIFENLSDSSDIEILSHIISNEKSVETIKPNWEKRNLPR